jgi:dephospho-CoA kinase
VGAAGAIDRQKLGKRVFADPAALHRLEAILHPLAAAAGRRFVATHARNRRRILCLDVPLLLETASVRRCDFVVVVSASAMLQRQRALARPGMTADKFTGILARQMPDAEKRRRADLVAISGLGLRTTLRTLQKALRLAKAAPQRRQVF